MTRLDEIKARVEEPNLTANVVPAHYLMAAPAVSKPPAVDPELAAARSRIADLSAQITASQAREAEKERRIAELEKCLWYFMGDARFQTCVGGNPIAVERMLDEVRNALSASQPADVKGEP